MESSKTHTKDAQQQQQQQQEPGTREWDDPEDSKALVTPLSMEEEFDKVPIPPWREQITPRALVVSTLLGGFFCIITHKLTLTVGVIPSLNVAAGLFGFFFIRLWIGVLSRLKIFSKPFTRQENTVIQTAVVSCYGLAFSGGYGMYIIALDRTSFNIIGEDTPGNRAVDVKQPALGWLYPLIFSTAFLGIMVLVPLRKVMILKYNLTYPSGTATALIINSFHTPEGARVAKKQVRSLLSTTGLSVFFSFFKWFFSGGTDTTCGFDNFPSLGLKAFRNKFMFDFSLIYIGAGMICPHIVNISVLLGAIVSWGILWPLIENHRGDWFPANAVGTSFKGLYAYKVFLAIALILGDGLYNFAKISILSARSIHKHYRNSQRLPDQIAANGGVTDDEITSPDEKRRIESFLKDRIPTWVAISLYVALAAIAIVSIPHILPPVKWYYVLISYIVAPVLAFCNSYGMGLTDWSLTSSYGKFALFIFAAWSGSEAGGVVAGLGSCGMMMTIVASAADLMQDFKTGYLTRSSPRAMFVSQLFGALMGCLLAPLTFWMFWTAFEIGDPNGVYKAPSGVIYRQMAIIGVEGFSALPKHCLQLSYGFFCAAIAINIIRDVVPAKVSRFIPIPMAMGIPFYLGAYFAIDMFLGTCIVFVWKRLNKKQADVHVPAVASGLICGDGIWTVPAAILALAKVSPPICMMFYPSSLATSVQKQFPV